MALENTIYIETGKRASDVKQWMIDEIGCVQDEDPRYLTETGILFFVKDGGAFSVDVEEKYGFSPSVSIYCRLDKFDNFSSGFLNLLELLHAIFREVSRNFVIFGPGGETILLCKDDKFLLQEGSWNEDQMSLLDVKYSIGKIENV